MPIVQAENPMPDLIGSIYDSAIEDGTWENVLGDICAAFDATAGGLSCYDFSRMKGFIRSSINIGDEYCRSYNLELCKKNPWMHSPSAYRQGAISTGEELFPTERLVTTEFYDKFLRPQGFLHRLCGVFAQHGPITEFVVLLRPAEATPFDKSDKGLLGEVLPHLVRSWEIRDRLSQDREERQNLFEVLDHLPVACLLVNRGGQVRFINASAEHLLARRDGLMVAGGCLTAATTRDTVRLRRIIAESAVSKKAFREPLSGEHTILSRGSDRPPLVCIIFPIHRTELDDVHRRDRAVAILVKDPDYDNLGSLDDFAGAYGLTPAEARLIALLTGGLGLNQAANRLGITKNTARTHMRSIYSKVGAHRQADLVRLLGKFTMF